MTVNSYGVEELPLEFICGLEQSGSFFTSWEWYQLFVAALTPSGYSFLTLERPDFRLVLPTHFEQTSSGRILASLSNYYSPLYNITQIPDNNPQSQGLPLLLQELPNWDIVRLQPMTQEAATETCSVLNFARIPTLTFFCFGNWYLEVNGRTYADYFSGLCSRLKNTVIRKAKKFSAMPGARLSIVNDMANLDAALSDYHQVYAASWKTEESHPEFISGLCRLAANQGALRLGLAHLDGVPIAAQLWIVADGTAYIYKLAYNEAYKTLGVGSVLTAHLMQHVLDVDKVTFVDYLTGDDSYKKEWMSARRERWGVLAFNSTSWLGLVAMFRAFGKKWLKTAFNSITGKPL